MGIGISFELALGRTQLVGPGAEPPSYIMRDQYPTDIDPLVDAAADPGPGSRDVTGTAFKIVDGVLRVSGSEVGTLDGTRRLVYSGIARTDGYALAAYVIPSDQTDEITVGWATTTTENDPTTDGHSWVNDEGRYYVAVPGEKLTLASLQENTHPIEYLVVIALKAAGALYMLSAIGADWASEMQDPYGIPAYPDARLMWVDDADATATLYPQIQIGATADDTYPNGHLIADMRVVEVPSWADEGLATVVDRALKTAGGQFATAASADGIFHFTMTFDPVSATAPCGIMFRRVDANNYFRIWTNGGATFYVQSIVGGAFSATLTSTVYTWQTSGVYHFVIEARGTKFRIYMTGAGASLDSGWLTSSDHLTGTGFGSYEQSATGATWDDLIHYPHTVTLPSQIKDGKSPLAWGSGSVVASDAFAGTNGASLSGRSTDAGGETWTVDSGTWTIQSNKASVTAASGQTVAYIDAPGDSYEVEVDITFDNPYTAVLGGLVINFDAATGNAIFVRLLSGERDEIELVENATGGGGFSGIAKKIDLTDHRFVAGGTYNLRAQVTPGLVRVFLDDVIRLSHPVSQAFTGSGVGLYDAGNYTIDWDNFTVRSLTTPAGSTLGTPPAIPEPPADSFPAITGVIGRYYANALPDTDGTVIGQWDDLSGNGRHATAAGAARPTIKENIVGGKKVLRFNGTANGMTIAAIDLSAKNAITMYAVINTTAVTTLQVITERSANYNSVATGWLHTVSTTNAITAAIHGADYSDFTTTGTLSTTHRLVRIVMDKSLATNEVTVALNHSAAGSRGSNNNNTASGFGNEPIYIGGRTANSFFLFGDIAFLLFVDHDTAGADDTAIQAWILSEMGV